MSIKELQQQTTVNVQEKANLIWAIADKLVGVYKPHEYGNVILPMCVVKRFEDTLAPTKQKVLEMNKQLDEDGITVKQGFLEKAAGQKFYNLSPFTFETLLSDPENIRENFESYLNHFSENVIDVIHRMKFQQEIETMAENGLLYLVIKEFCTEKAYLIRVDIKECFCKKYIRYCLQQAIATVIVDSVSIATWSISLWNEQHLPFPSLAEQQHIANYLDKKCGKIDRLISLQEQMIAQLTDYKQSVITEVVTKGLNPEAQLVPSGIDWIGYIPKGWKVLPIKYVKTNEKNAFVDGPFGSNLKSEHFIENGDVLVIESGFITTGKFVYKEFKTITRQHFETIKRSECKAHDIIIAKIGANYGMAGELPDFGKKAVVSGNSLKITLDNAKMSSARACSTMSLSSFIPSLMATDVQAACGSRLSLVACIRYSNIYP